MTRAENLKEMARRHGPRAAIVVFLGVVLMAPIVISASSLHAYGVDVLGLGDRVAWALPVALDAAALTMVALRWDSTVRGDSAAGPTAMFWALVAGSAAANARHGAAVSDDAVVVLAAMPVVAAMVLDVVLRHARRDALRALGAIEEPLARFRFARWLVAPRETAGAWRASVTEGVTSSRDAIDRYRGDVPALTAGHPTSNGHRTPDTGHVWADNGDGTAANRVPLHVRWDNRPDTDMTIPDMPDTLRDTGHRMSADTDTADTRTRPVPPTRPDTGQWDTLADAVRTAVSAVGPDTDTVLAWLTDNGVPDANRDTVRKTITRASADTRTDKETTT